MRMSKNKLMMIIFDMDGVIFDSEPLHAIAKKRILQDYNITDKIDLSWSIGRPIQELWEKIIPEYQIPNTPEALELLQYKYVIEEMNKANTKISNGLYELLKWAKKNKYIIGLASSSNRFLVDYAIDFLQIKDYFDYTIAGDEVAVKKPNPDIYISAIKMANILPSQAIAIEDSTSGVRAATSAGVGCIGYHNETSGDQDLSLSNYTINSLDKVITLLENNKLSI